LDITKVQKEHQNKIIYNILNSTTIFIKNFVCCLEIMDIDNRSIIDFIWRGYKQFYSIIKSANISLDYCFLKVFFFYSYYMINYFNKNFKKIFLY